jgi:hypothetical protein
MKKGYGLLGIPHILATCIWLAIAVLIGVSLGRMVWACAAEILAFGRPDHSYTITISTGDNIDTIANKLAGESEFTYGQAELIHETLFPEYSIRYVFHRAEAA